MKTPEEIKKRFEDLFNQRSDLGIKMDMASKMNDKSVYSTCSDKIYKLSIQMRELAWVLDGDVIP